MDAPLSWRVQSYGVLENAVRVVVQLYARVRGYIGSCILLMRQHYRFPGGAVRGVYLLQVRWPNCSLEKWLQVKNLGNARLP